MTPDQAQTTHTLALAALVFGLAEILLGLVLSRSANPQTKNISHMLFTAGPCILVAAAILNWGTDFWPTLIAALIVFGVGNNLGIFRMARAAKKIPGSMAR